MENLAINEFKVFEDVTKAWEFWFERLANMGKNQSSRDGDVVGEIINAVTVIENPKKNLVESRWRNLSKTYAIGELLWYLSADISFKTIQNYTKAWDRMSDDGETVNSNYGHKIHRFYGFDQWEYVKKLLTDDPYSRQAVIHIKNPMNYKTKDTPCTVCLQFFIRGGKLYLTTYMRSNDVWFGFPYDVFNFTCFQIKMAMELGVGIGSYTHIAGSLHLYKRDLEKLKVKEDTSGNNEKDKKDETSSN